MHLIGSFPDLGDFCIAHQTLHTVIADIAVATVHLHCLGRHAHGQIAGPQLGYRCLYTKTSRAVGDETGDIIEPRLSHSQLGREVRDKELVGLEIDAVVAAHGARIHIGHHVLEGGGRNSERVRRNARSRLVERRQQQGKPLAGLAEKIGARHPALVMNSLFPSTTMSSPSGVKRIVMAVASEPPAASVMASEASAPAATRGSKRFFCSSVPKSISGFMPWKLVA